MAKAEMDASAKENEQHSAIREKKKTKSQTTRAEQRAI